ncbi:aminopeptidase N-like isoform X2 [Diachasmimorpha longicaudata]|uniref:aminopeptidase N-like isoform X2 n=1 Tax=Diachasmimorpha longicaudata TaxID=58733 RepID=UPI0030B8B3BD
MMPSLPELEYYETFKESANMAQFASSRQEFMTSEPGLNGIEYQRGGGYFLSHKKIAIFITVIFLSLVAVGFIGAYAGAIPKKKTFDATALIAEDEGSEPADADKYSLSSEIFPLRYHIDLTPTPTDNGVSVVGHVIVQFHYTGSASLDQIVLNAKSMNIINMRLLEYNSENGDETKRKKRENDDDDDDDDGPRFPESELLRNGTGITDIDTSKNQLDNEHGILRTHLPKRIKKGLYALEINYEALVDNRTLRVANFSDDSGDRWLMASRLKPINARRLFPVFDDVRLKAKFVLSVAHEESIVVLSNTPAKFRSPAINCIVIETFEETPLMSPHNLVLIQGQVELVDNIRVNEKMIRFWRETNVDVNPSYLKNMTQLVLDNFEELFAINLHLPQLDIVCVPFAENYGSPGIITIIEPLFNVTNTSPGITRYEALQTLIRLIGQQWLGGLVNSQNWTDVWILESSLTDLQHSLIPKLDPTFNHSTFILDVQLDAFEADGYTVSQSLKSKVNPAYLEAFHPDELYDRGACLLRMLHGALRQNESWIGYRKFVNRWANGNGDVASFLEAMTDDAEDIPEGINAIAAMNSWISSHGYPVLNVERDYSSGSARVHQERFSFDNLTVEPQHPWYLPLSWITEDGNWSSPSFTWLKSAETTIDSVGNPDEKSWVIFNVNSTGYYRINYDPDNWQLIARALGENPTEFPSPVKASLVDDVLSLAFVGSTSYDTAFSLINYLRNESQPEPWTALMRHAIKLNLVLYDTPIYPKYQEYMKKLTSNFFQEFGLDINHGRRLTLVAHQLGSTFGIPEYVSWAKENAEGLKTSPEWESRHLIPSYLRETLLCTLADELEWQWWQEKLGNITKRDDDRNSFLSSLACFQVPWMLQAVLNEIVKGEFFEEAETLVILRAFDKHPVAAEVAFQFVRKNWADIVKKFHKSYPVLRAFIGSISSGFTSEKDFSDFVEFREDNYDSLKPVGYITAFVEAKGNSWVSFLNTSFVNFEKTMQRI